MVISKPSSPADTPLRTPHMLVLSGKTTQQDYAVTRHVKIIGADSQAAIRLTSWFAPETAAMITRRTAHYVIGSGRSGKPVLVNGKTVSGEQTLKEGDRIEVAGVTLLWAMQGKKTAKGAPPLVPIGEGALRKRRIALVGHILRMILQALQDPPLTRLNLATQPLYIFDTGQRMPRALLPAHESLLEHLPAHPRELCHAAFDALPAILSRHRLANLARGALEAALAAEQPGRAITGPAARGDGEIVLAEHRELLRAAPEVAPLVVTLARESLRQQARLGPLSASQASLDEALSRADLLDLAKDRVLTSDSPDAG